VHTQLRQLQVACQLDPVWVKVNRVPERQVRVAGAEEEVVVVVVVAPRLPPRPGVPGQQEDG
jgi:hypothetical protein